MVAAISFGSQASIYALRDRHHFWGPRLTNWLIGSSIADITIISTLALLGIAMTPIPIWMLAAEFSAALAFGLILSAVKIPLFARLHIA